MILENEWASACGDCRHEGYAVFPHSVRAATARLVISHIHSIHHSGPSRDHYSRRAGFSWPAAPRISGSAYRPVGPPRALSGPRPVPLGGRRPWNLNSQYARSACRGLRSRPTGVPRLELSAVCAVSGSGAGPAAVACVVVPLTEM